MKADASVERSPPPLRGRLPDRLLRDGPHFLSDAELVAALLHSSCRGGSAIVLAQDLLNDVDGLAGLGEIDGNLIERSGIGPVRASILIAARELAARLGRTRLIGRQIIDRRARNGSPAAHRPATVANYITLRYGRPDQEVLGVLLLDIRQRLITDCELFRGTLRDPAPSIEDLAFTRRMDSACRVVGIRLTDHLVVGGLGRWVSLAERGQI